MKHALARGLTYEQHMRTITWREALEWEALASVEPLFDDRADFHAAMICTVIAGIVSKHPPRIEDFMPQWGSEVGSARQTAEEQQEIAKMIHEMFTEGKRN